MKRIESKNIIDKLLQLDNAIDFVFEADNGSAHYKKVENDDIIAEQSTCELKIGSQKIRFRYSEIKNKKTGEKKNEIVLI